MQTTSATITVRLFAGLEAQTRLGRSEVRLALVDAPTVGALTVFLGLPRGVAGIILVNGLHARDDRPLEAGDEVSMFPPLGGG
jgi:molybdopterin converting factor small subunit